MGGEPLGRVVAYCQKTHVAVRFAEGIVNIFVDDVLSGRALVGQRLQPRERRRVLGRQWAAADERAQDHRMQPVVVRPLVAVRFVQVGEDKRLQPHAAEEDAHQQAVANVGAHRMKRQPVAGAEGAEGTLESPAARLWHLRNA